MDSICQRQQRARRVQPAIAGFWFALVGCAWLSAPGWAAAADRPELPGLGEPGKAMRLTIDADASTDSAGHDATGLKLMGPDSRLQLVVTSHHQTGQVRDVTGSVQYDVRPAGIVKVDSNGSVVPLADGTASIAVRGADGMSAATEITVERYHDAPLVNFPNKIVPIFTKAGCNSGGCHGKSGGQNGFALSLLGFEPQEDYVHLLKEARGRRIFPAAPQRSLLLQKAIGAVPHGGGARIDADSDDYRVMRRWIEQGTPYGSDDDPVVSSIRVFPRHRLLPLTGTQQLRVLAHYSDGSTEDVTRTATYDPNNKEMAKVDQTGLVEVLGQTGEVGIMIRYQGQVGVFRATIPMGVEVENLPAARNFVDQLAFAKLKQLGLPPSELADDATLLRRTTLAIAGRMPTLAETEQYLADNSAEKHDRLIDRLLQSDDYANYFAQKWASILRNKAENNLHRAGNFLFHDWLRRQLKENVPYEQLVSQIVTASGDVGQNPPVNWFRHLSDSSALVEDTAQVFLGVRIQCAKCHHHPFEKWSQSDYWGMAAFYSTLERAPGRREGEQRIYAKRDTAAVRHPKSGEQIVPTSLGGEPLELTPDDDPRLALAAWIRSEDNPFVARTLVNRYWKHFFGRGLVDPEDDMRATNPPSHPELLDELARQFINSGYDLQQLIRTICQSTTFRLASLPNEYNGQDRQGFSRFYPRRLPAEVLLDSIDRFLGTKTNFRGLPQEMRAIQLPDHGEIDNYFLNTFGRPAAGSACECERTGEVSMAQSLHLLNSDDMYGKLSGARSAELANDAERTAAEKVRELYLRAFSRPATEQEVAALVAHVEKAEEGKQREAWEDVLWAIVNTKEFMYTH